MRVRSRRNPISHARAVQLAEIRLQHLREEVLSGATEMVGKTYREGGTGRVVGRFRGGFTKIYPELARSGVTPSQASKAIGSKRKGKVYRRLLRSTLQEIDREHGPIGQKLYKEKRVIPAHASVTGKCKLCGVMHGRKQHKFHGEGAFSRTHLFSFNPGMRKRKLKNPRGRLTKIYEKVLRIEAQKGPGHKCDWACARAGHRYFHVFTTKPKMYGLKDGTIWIKS